MPGSDSRGVGADDVGKGVVKWLEPRLKRSPALQTLAVNRMSYLLRAGGSHRAFILMKSQAGWIEVQPTIIEQRSHLPLGVSHHGLVMDTINSARKNLIDVVHEVDVAFVKMTDIGQ